MRRSVGKFKTPRATPLGIWTFEDWLVQNPFPRSKKAVQMPHQLVLNYLSSKTNFIFNQTLYTPFRERYAVMTPLYFFKKTLLKELFTKKGEILSCKSVKPCKDWKTHERISSEQEINLVQIPPSLATLHRQMPGCTRGDAEVSNWSAQYSQFKA